MFTCSHCDSQSLKWAGRCTECGQWGTLVDEGSIVTTSKTKGAGVKPAPVLRLDDAAISDAQHQPTGIDELDRVLSGGLVPGSVTLLAGEPGIGKSTLVAQLAASPTSYKLPATSSSYYVSGEESHSQVLMRFKRLGLDVAHVSFSNNVEIGAVIAAAQNLKPALLIIDSIQTMISQEIDNVPGSPTAVRAATAQLIGYAKSTNTPVLLIGQVTKEGTVAGPKTLEHLVDTMLTLEGDAQSPYRILRAVKNRFGQTDEVGIFEMTERGLVAVANPSARFLEERVHAPGSAITCVMEGSRPLLIEVQALVEKSLFTNPIRRTSGFDTGRLQMLLAIIGRRAGVSVAGLDVYVNVIGGLPIKEHAADLAVCTAIISSVKDQALAKEAVYVGEVGLSGEIRSVPFLERRIKEADRLGFKKSITPKSIKNLREIIQSESR
jgi:DNA repair protein RadA/Sms